MAKIYTYEWAVGKWEGRATLTYKPTDKDAGDCPAIPAHLAGLRIPDGRIPCKAEDTGKGVYYITYCSDSNSPIIRVTEVEG